MVAPVEVAPSPIVGMSFEAPARQRRATVAFRVILALPHFLYAGVLGTVLFFATVAGWFAAVFTGRLPAGIADFDARLLRYLTRVYGYAYFLLTDRYPPFDLDPEPYPVELELPPPGRLNRAAVLFRLILLVPPGIVMTIVGYGLWIPLIVVWLIVLVSGRMPRAPFEALAAVLRYQYRVMAYGTLLTSEYPRGLLGDKPTPVMPFVDGDDLPPPAAEGEPRITRLVLSKAARRLVVLIVVLGALTLAGVTTVGAISGIRSRKAYDEFVAADRAARVESQAFERAVQTCAISGGLPCLHRADVAYADAVARFRQRLEQIHFPANALGAAGDLDHDAGRFEDALRSLATVNGLTQYTQGVTRLQQIASRVNQDELALSRLLDRFSG